MSLWMFSPLLNVQVGNIFKYLFLCQHNQVKMDGEPGTHSGPLDNQFPSLNLSTVS